MGCNLAKVNPRGYWELPVHAGNSYPKSWTRCPANLNWWVPNSSPNPEAHCPLRHRVLILTYLISSVCPMVELITPAGQKPSWNQLLWEDFFLWRNPLKDSCANLSRNFPPNIHICRTWHMKQTWKISTIVLTIRKQIIITCTYWGMLESGHKDPIKVKMTDFSLS